MGLFARDAPWLRILFPASSAPQTRQPGRVSDDIQLVEYYQAGGQVQTGAAWRLLETPLNPGQNLHQGIVIVPPNEVWRVRALSIAINPAPAAQFDFRIVLFYASDTPDFSLDLDQAEFIAAGSLAQNTIVQSAVTTGIFTGSPTAPGEPEEDTVGLALFQESAQAFNTEQLEVRAFIQRNVRGVAHVV